MAKPRYLLASSSPYRAKLLEQLGVEFEQCSPDVDESALPDERPSQTALRLSEKKALALSERFSEHIIVASDQVACVEGSNQALGKPLTEANAIKQLSLCSAKSVRFYTGLCLMFPDSIAKPLHKPKHMSLSEHFDVHFRALSLEQISHYIRREQPLLCAGSFKAEGLGIGLFKAFSGRDYNSLIGLPLMALVDCLEEYNIDILSS